MTRQTKDAFLSSQEQISQDLEQNIIKYSCLDKTPNGLGDIETILNLCIQLLDSLKSSHINYMNNGWKWLTYRGYSEEKYREKIERYEMFISNSQKEIDMSKRKRSFISKRDSLSLSQSESKIDFCEASASHNIPSTYPTLHV